MRFARLIGLSILTIKKKVKSSEKLIIIIIKVFKHLILPLLGSWQQTIYVKKKLRKPN